MATPREIRRRIRSIKNIAKVTRAMEMVAAAKMRRAQQQVLAMRPYAEKAWEVLVHLASQRGVSEELHPLLRRRPVVSRVGLVLITSNKGLCGAYNHNVLRLADDFLERTPVPVELITVGRVGRNAMLRAGRPILADFENIPDQPSLTDVRPVARVAIDDFLSGRLDEVYLLYTDFVNTMVQRPHVRRLLPLPCVTFETDQPWCPVSPTISQTEYVYEPDPRELLEGLLPRFTELQIYEALLEASASEHSARMVAMRSATDNAQDLVADLTLTYNQARQAAITKEMLDIAGGTEALAKMKGREFAERMPAQSSALSSRRGAGWRFTGESVGG